jgi:hypothetical protein
MNDVELCALLAWRLHGTMEAVRRTLHTLKDRVKRTIRPLVVQLARHPKLGDWLVLIANTNRGSDCART